MSQQWQTSSIGGFAATAVSSASTTRLITSPRAAQRSTSRRRKEKEHHRHGSSGGRSEGGGRSEAGGKSEGGGGSSGSGVGSAGSAALIGSTAHARSRSTSTRSDTKRSSSVGASPMSVLRSSESLVVYGGEEFNLDVELTTSVRRTLVHRWEFQQSLDKWYRRIADAQSLLSLAAILLAALDVELVWTGEYDSLNGLPTDVTVSTHRHARTITKAILTAVSVAQVALVFAFYRAKREDLANRRGYPDDASFLRAPFRRRMLIEILVNALHIPPGAEWTFGVYAMSMRVGGVPTTVRYHLDIFNLLLVARLYHWTRTLLMHSRLSGASSHFFGLFTVIKATPQLVGKFLIYQTPITFLASTFALLMLLLSWALRACERPVEPRLDDFGNALWLSIVSVVSVGYGDIFPRTACGRAVTVTNFLTGIIVSSLVIAVVGIKTTFSLQEASFIKVLRRDELNRLTQHAAARLVQTQWRLNKLRADVLTSPSTVAAAWKAAHAAKREWSKIRRDLSEHDIFTRTDSEALVDIETAVLESKDSRDAELRRDRSRERERRLEARLRMLEAKLDAVMSAVGASAGLDSEGGRDLDERSLGRLSETEELSLPSRSPAKGKARRRKK